MRGFEQRLPRLAVEDAVADRAFDGHFLAAHRNARAREDHEILTALHEMEGVASAHLVHLADPALDLDGPAVEALGMPVDGADRDGLLFLRVKHHERHHCDHGQRHEDERGRLGERPDDGLQHGARGSMCPHLRPAARGPRLFGQELVIVSGAPDRALPRVARGARSGLGSGRELGRGGRTGAGMERSGFARAVGTARWEVPQVPLARGGQPLRPLGGGSGAEVHAARGSVTLEIVFVMRMIHGVLREERPLVVIGRRNRGV